MLGNAKILQSCSVLEEYLKEDYIQTVANNSSNENSLLTKAEFMAKLHSNYFFYNGTYDYVIFEHEYKENGEPKVEFLKIRLINKENLNEDLKKQLKGGDANGGERESYLNFKDVYGVTDDLKVFYCQDGILSSIGANYLDCEILDCSKVIQEKGSVASKALAETLSSQEKDLTITDLRIISELVVSDKIGANDLGFLIDMPNLKKLTLKNYQGSLSGLKFVSDLTYIYFNNSENGTSIDYSDLRYCLNLHELYFFNPTDAEIRKMCEEMSNTDYYSLVQIGLVGYIEDGQNYWITSLAGSFNKMDKRSELSTLESLKLLTKGTKNSIKKLYLNNNKLNSLNGIGDFVGLNCLYVNNNSNSSLEIGDYVKNMIELTDLYCSYCNIENNDFGKISLCTKIKNLSIAGDANITDLNFLVDFTELRGLQARGIPNLILNDDVLSKIAHLSEFFLDDRYNTALTLANIGEHVVLSSDVDETSFMKLKNSEKVEILEIPNCKNINNDKLQEVLSSLKNLSVLIADKTNLNSFNFIGENSKLEEISVLDTNVLDLTPLSKCELLYGLRINTNNLNLLTYSKIISNICKKNWRNNRTYKTGTVPIGGINSTISILQTLNGTEEEPNSDLTYFNCYEYNLGGRLSDNADKVLDFTNTSIETIGTSWCPNLTIVLPDTFKNVDALELAGITLDYRNVTEAESFCCNGSKFMNIENFKGYKFVSCFANPVDMIGNITEKIIIGKIECSGRTITQTSLAFDNFLEQIVKKAPNVKEMSLFGIKGLNDISVLRNSSLETLEIQYSPISNISSEETNFEKLGSSLKNLIIKNCSSFTSLNGLVKLNCVTNLEISNTNLEEYMTVNQR